MMFIPRDFVQREALASMGRFAKIALLMPRKSGKTELLVEQLARDILSEPEQEGDTAIIVMARNIRERQELLSSILRRLGLTNDHRPMFGCPLGLELGARRRFFLFFQASSDSKRYQESLRQLDIQRLWLYVDEYAFVGKQTIEWIQQKAIPNVSRLRMFCTPCNCIAMPTFDPALVETRCIDRCEPTTPLEVVQSLWTTTENEMISDQCYLLAAVRLCHVVLDRA